MCSGGAGGGGGSASDAAGRNPGRNSGHKGNGPSMGDVGNLGIGTGKGTSNTTGNKATGPSSVSFGGKSYAPVKDRYGRNVTSGFSGATVASGMEVNGVNAKGNASMDRARGKKNGTLAGYSDPGFASYKEDQLGLGVAAVGSKSGYKDPGFASYNENKKDRAAVATKSKNSSPSYGGLDLLAGILEGVLGVPTLGAVDFEINGMDYSIAKGRPVAKDKGLHFNPAKGLATAFGGPLGGLAMNSLQDFTGTTPGTFDEDGNVNTAMSMLGSKKGTKTAGGVSLGTVAGRPGLGVAEDNEVASLGGLAGKTSPGNNVGRDGGGGSQRLVTSKQKVAKAGSRATSGAGIPSTQAPSINFSTGDDEDDIFSLYRRMLSGYFKGAKV